MDETYQQPCAPTPDVDFAPDNYTQWVADMIAQSSYPPPPEVIGQSSYQPPPETPSESSSSGDHQIRAQVDRGLGRGHPETRRPPCGTGGCLDPVVGRRGCGRGPR
ncbi:hypothetical protein PIB30_051736 [Stylosanthes scabra]|uniref:Uncharacterized protein n=1 Tax=Stylosanthes scabra TaxID=79078 RepID=A0ABU6SHV4_9FABA|nr:hypothetical protein [Stylosanthes scabra]